MNCLETIELPETIRTIQDVVQFHRALWAEGLNYHPEEDFFNYVSNDKVDEFGEPLPSYTHEEATLRNALLDQAYAVCDAAGVDICSVGLEEFIFLVCGTWYSEEDQDDKEYPVETELEGLAQKT